MLSACLAAGRCGRDGRPRRTDRLPRGRIPLGEGCWARVGAHGGAEGRLSRQGLPCHDAGAKASRVVPECCGDQLRYLLPDEQPAEFCFNWVEQGFAG